MKKRVRCQMSAWFIEPTDDDQAVSDVNVTLWIDGDAVGGRIHARVVQNGDELPHVAELYHDDFNLPDSDRAALLVAVFCFIGSSADCCVGRTTDPLPFELWLLRRWYLRPAIRLYKSIERTIRTFVPEPAASGGRPGSSR